MFRIKLNSSVFFSVQVIFARDKSKAMHSALDPPKPKYLFCQTKYRSALLFRSEKYTVYKILLRSFCLWKMCSNRHGPHKKKKYHSRETISIKYIFGEILCWKIWINARVITKWMERIGKFQNRTTWARPHRQYYIYMLLKIENLVCLYFYIFFPLATLIRRTFLRAFTGINTCIQLSSVGHFFN